MIMTPALLFSAVLAVSALTMSSGVHAQVSSEEIVRSLQPKQGLTRSIRSRAIEILPGKEAEVIDKNKDLPKINLTIEFEYNSDRPTPAGEKQLVALAEALKDPTLKDFRYLLAGHTDARGSDDYNQALSERRAVTVQRFLISTIKFDPTRLQTVGFGEKRLLDTQDPGSPRNRRVEIVNLLN
jgi:outer membrane protein OmpA-like peptidoglycan-associated protein